MASTSLTKTGSTGDSRRIFTHSVWVKRSNVSKTDADMILNSAIDESNQYYFELEGNSVGDDNDIRIRQLSSGSVNTLIKTSASFRDVSAWYHIVVAVDTTQATASDRIKLYVNGSQITSFDSSTYPSQNTDMEINTTSYTTHIGKRNNNSNYYDGSMAHLHFIDGTAYDADTFGETDATTGIWKPKTAPSVTYGTNGFFLKFENSGAFGTDSSGNANNFTVAGGTMTQTIDTPSNVFATLNALVPASRIGTLSNGNLKIVSSADNFYSPSTLYVSKGKWYAEFKLTDTTRAGVIGAISSNANLNTSFWGGSYGTGINAFNNLIYNYDNGGSTTSFTGTISQNDIIGIALDMDNKKIYAYHNGSLLTNGTITGNALNNYDLSTIDDYWTIGFGNDSNYTIEANFGNGYFGTTAVSSAQNPDDGIGIFEHTPPTGYKALCTKSINAQEYD